MSEVNLNEEVTMVVEDATVITTLIDDTLTVSGDAADAKAVGDALATKVDADDVMEHVTITFDGIESDNQGILLVNGDDIPIDDSNNAPDIKSYIDNVGSKTGSAIAVSDTDSTKISAKFTAVEGQLFGDQLPMSSSDSTKVATAIATVDAKTANEIDYVSGTTIKAKIDAIDARITTAENAHLVKTAQELTSDQKTQVRTNIGLGSAATQDVANNLTTESQGYALDARQGKALSDTLTTQAGQITALQATNNRVNLTGSVTFDNVDSGNVGTYVADTLKVFRYGNMCHLEFGVKFSSSQSSNCQAFGADFHGLPKMAGSAITGIGAGATYSVFRYYMTTEYHMIIRFMHNNSNAQANTTYTQVIEYIIDDNAGGSENQEQEEST